MITAQQEGKRHEKAKAILIEEPFSEMLQAVREHNASLDSVTRGGPLGKTLGVTGRLSRGLLEAQQHRSQLEKHEAAGVQRLEDLIRLRANNPKATLQALHLQPFADVRPRGHAFPRSTHYAHGEPGHAQ
jgi:hypothetical protein